MERVIKFNNQIIVSLLLFVVLLTMFSCTDWESDDANLSVNQYNKKVFVSNELTNSGIIELGDPYKFDNILAAYMNLVDKGDILNKDIIKPTHTILKVFPRNEKEQYELENMENIFVSYIPFSCVYLPQDINNDEVDIYNNQVYCKYVVDKEYVETSSDSIVNTSLLMPVLYVSWPKSKPLPENYDFQIEYEAFNPYYYDRTEIMKGNSYTCTSAEIRLIEKEAITLWRAKSRSTSETEYRKVSGAIYYSDSYTSTTPPLHNLQVRFQLGSVMWETMTNSRGEYVIGDSLPIDATYSIRFWHPKWRLTRGGTTPISYTMGNVGDFWNDNTKYRVAYRKDSRALFESHVAVNYYYYGNHQLPKYTLPNGIRIETLDVYDEDANGYFWYSQSDPPYIQVFKEADDQTPKLIAVVLHELGHNVMYQAYASYNTFYNTEKFIKESWASFSGWYMCREYYKTLNVTEQDGRDSFTAQSWQNWKKTYEKTNIYSSYSPILIDLIDSYNQVTYKSTYNNDPISGFPVSEMIDFGVMYKTWNEYRAALEDYVGVYYTLSEFNDFIAPYDYFWNQ